MKLLALLLTLVLMPPAFALSPSVNASGKLKTLQAKAATQDWTFTVGYNPMMEYSLSEITGVRAPADWRQKAMFISPTLTRSLPSSYDLRQLGNGLTPIKNQGQCGSCWAFGTVGVLENLIKIRDGITKVLSEQYLVNCDQNSSGCGGGYYAHDLHQTPGSVLDSDLPYQAYNGNCTTSPYQNKIESWAYVGDQNSSPLVDQVKQAIYTYGPVAITVTASNEFQAYNGGVFNADTGEQTNHIVDLVGWNDDDGAWILRNSWGADWGENGYMRIKYGVSRVAETATFVIYKAACIPQPVAYIGESSAQTIHKGQSVLIGGMPILGQTYTWTPAAGLDDATSSSPMASPLLTTTYTLSTSSSCGHGTRQVTVAVN